MRACPGLIGVSLICNAAGFTTVKVPIVPTSFSFAAQHDSRSCWSDKPVSKATTVTSAAVAAWASRRPTRIPTFGSRAGKTTSLSAEASEQQETASEAMSAPAPRLKRVRKRRKDAGDVATADEEKEEEDGGSSDVIVNDNAPRLVDPVVQAATSAIVEEAIVPDVRETVENVVEAIEEVVSPSPAGAKGTKGTKVRVAATEDDITERFSGAASAASDAAGGAASAVSKAAQSAMGSAMSMLGQGAPEVPAEYDDYISTFQGAKRTDSGEKSSGPDLEDLGADIARFRAKEKGTREVAGVGESFALGAKDVISTIISIDFFVVIAFMLWFIAGVVGTYVFDNTFLLDEFNESWTPIVQPALGVLMGGTIAGGVVSKLGESGEEDENKR